MTHRRRRRPRVLLGRHPVDHRDRLRLQHQWRQLYREKYVPQIAPQRGEYSLFVLHDVAFAQRRLHSSPQHWSRFVRIFLRNKPIFRQVVRLNGRARPQPLCLPSRISRACFLFVPNTGLAAGFVPCRARLLAPPNILQKIRPAPRAPLSLTHIGPRKSLSKLVPASPSFGALPDTIELCPGMNSPARTTLPAGPVAQPAATRTTRNECPKHPTPSLKPLKSTLNLPQTAFPMKANLPLNEPLRLSSGRTPISTARSAAPAPARPATSCTTALPTPTAPSTSATPSTRRLKDFVVKIQDHGRIRRPLRPRLRLPRPAHRDQGRRAARPQKARDGPPQRSAEPAAPYAQKYLDLQTLAVRSHRLSSAAGPRPTPP